MAVIRQKPVEFPKKEIKRKIYVAPKSNQQRLYEKLDSTTDDEKRNRFEELSEKEQLRILKRNLRVLTAIEERKKYIKSIRTVVDGRIYMSRKE